MNADDIKLERLRKIAEVVYKSTPISVLRYISALESAISYIDLKKIDNHKNKDMEDKQKKLAAAFELMADGVLYKPKKCKQNVGTYKDGCGKCGTGSSETCYFSHLPTVELDELDEIITLYNKREIDLFELINRAYNKGYDTGRKESQV